MKNLEKLLSVWKRRNLTIFVKCTIINTLAISKKLYNDSILQNPDNDFFQKCFKNYIQLHLEKRDRIKRNTLIDKIEYGGIGIIDVESKFYATKATWISRILNTEIITHRS